MSSLIFQYKNLLTNVFSLKNKITNKKKLIVDFRRSRLFYSSCWIRMWRILNRNLFVIVDLRRSRLYDSSCWIPMWRIILPWPFVTKKSFTKFFMTGDLYVKNNITLTLRFLILYFIMKNECSYVIIHGSLKLS
jgi:hypothetical protein